MHGKKHKEKTIELMKINNAMNKEEYRLKVKESKQNIKWLKKDNVYEKLNKVSKFSFEEMKNQIDSVVKKRGEGNLDKLLSGNEIWEVV